MKVSQNNQRLQKTKYLGSSAQDRVELEYKQRAHRGFSATLKGENREFEYGSLERILSILLIFPYVFPFSFPVLTETDIPLPPVFASCFLFCVPAYSALAVV